MLNIVKTQKKVSIKKKNLKFIFVIDTIVANALSAKDYTPINRNREYHATYYIYIDCLQGDKRAYSSSSS